MKTKKLIGYAVLGLALFLLSGGFQMVNGLMFGFETGDEARFGVTTLFFGGFLFTGFLGLIIAYRGFKDKWKVVLGLVMLVFSYVAIEVFYWFIV